MDGCDEDNQGAAGDHVLSGADQELDDQGGVGKDDDDRDQDDVVQVEGNQGWSEEKAAGVATNSAHHTFSFK